MRRAWLLLGMCVLGAASTAALAAPPRFAAPFFSYTSGFGANAVAIADVNLDSHPDVLVVSTSGLEVRLGSGDGMLGAPASFPAGSAQFLTLGDLDGDGDADAVTSADSLHVGVLLGQGDGTFSSPVSFPVSS